MEQVKAEPVACPCCSGETSMQEDHWRDGTLRGGEPFCRDCGLKMPRYWPRRKSDPTAAWNRRDTPQPAAVEGMVEQYRHALATIVAVNPSVTSIPVLQEIARQALAQTERKPEDGK